MPAKDITIGYPGQRTREVRVNFPGGSVYISAGLALGNLPAVYVSVDADRDRMAGEVPAYALVRVGEGFSGAGVRIVRGSLADIEAARVANGEIIELPTETKGQK